MSCHIKCLGRHFKNMMIEQRPESSKGANRAVIPGERIPGRENGKCKGPKMEACDVCHRLTVSEGLKKHESGDWER